MSTAAHLRFNDSVFHENYPRTNEIAIHFTEPAIFLCSTESSRTRTHNCSIDKEEVVCSIFCFCTGDETEHLIFVNHNNCFFYYVPHPNA
jgi:hypothetical protein